MEIIAVCCSHTLDAWRGRRININLCSLKMDGIGPYILLKVNLFQKHRQHRSLESQAAISEATISEALDL